MQCQRGRPPEAIRPARHRRAIGFRISGQRNPAKRARFKPRGVKQALIKGIGFCRWPIGDEAPQQTAFAPIGQKQHGAAIGCLRCGDSARAKPAKRSAFHRHGLRLERVKFHHMAGLSRVHTGQAPRPGRALALSQQQAAPGRGAAAGDAKNAPRRPARDPHVAQRARMQAAHLKAAFRHQPGTAKTLNIDQAGSLHGAGNLGPIPPVREGHGRVEARMPHREHGARNAIFNARRRHCGHHARIPAELPHRRGKIGRQRREVCRVIGNAIAQLYQ